MEYMFHKYEAKPWENILWRKLFQKIETLTQMLWNIFNKSSCILTAGPGIYNVKTKM